MQSVPTDRFLLARHVETLKNERSIHGASTLDTISVQGREQAREMASVCKQLSWVSRIIPAQTTQALATAQLISEMTWLPVDRPIALLPVRLGIASGKSQEELYRSSEQSAYSMDMFRYRAIPASKLDIPGAESLQEIVFRIMDWQNTSNFISFRGALVVTSSSILTMLANLIEGELPGPNYYNYVAPLGSIRAFELVGDHARPIRSLGDSSWPKSESMDVSTAWGHIKVTMFSPSWEARQATAIIIPGYFSNTRAGPYGLYTRLARRLAHEGITAYTFDPLGYGESDPMRRSIESDIVSLRAVIEQSDSAHLILIGHSIAGALVALSRQDLGAAAANITRIALAPVSGLDRILTHILSTDEAVVIRTHEVLIRHGMPVDDEYITSADRLWHIGCGDIDLAIFGGVDRAAQPSGTRLSDRTSVKVIDGADHNFSHTDSSQSAISAIAEFVRSTTSSVKVRLGIGGVD